MLHQYKMRAGAVVCAVALLSLTACAPKEEEQTVETVVRSTAVEVQSAVRADMAAQSTVAGQIAAKNAVAVIPLVSGIVTECNVKSGSQVTEGQVLFRVDTSMVTSSLGSLQASYSATQTMTQESINTAQTNLTNTEALFAVGAASQFQVDQARSALVQAQAGQQAQLAGISAQMASINEQAANGTVTAPCSGLVTAVGIVKGAVAGQQAAAVTIAEDGVLRVRADVSETLYRDLAVGGVAEVQIDAAFAEPVMCTIAELGVAANPQNNLYEVLLYVPEGDIAIGSFANVTFFTDVQEDVVQIPTEAILTDGSTDYVYIVDGDTASRVEITTGLVGDTTTAITAGLDGGETVVTVGQSFLSEGAAVRIVAED